MLLMLILKAFDGANGVIIYSAKLLFHCDRSTMRNTVLVSSFLWGRVRELLLSDCWSRLFQEQNVFTLILPGHIAKAGQ